MRAVEGVGGELPSEEAGSGSGVGPPDIEESAFPYMGKPTAWRAVATWAKYAYKISVRRSCRLFGVRTSSYDYRRDGRDDEVLLAAMRPKTLGSGDRAGRAA